MTTLRPLALAAVLAAGCTVWHTRYPLAEPMWEDPDTQHVEQMPKEYWSPAAWDAVDQTFFQPTKRALGLNIAGPAVNVNAVDEVPDSSWFENRIGLGDFTVEEGARGACLDDPLDPNGPWTVVRAKPNGADPGFMIKDAQGRGFLLKFDGHRQGERGSSADVIGSRLYHAFGFHSPCNQVVFFDPSILQVSPDAKSVDELGRKVPMTEEDVEFVLSFAQISADGLHRAAASQFVEGIPLGPWTYQGTRRDDPNDVIPHEDRREIRAARLMAAWINHIDAREQNSLTTWVDEDGRTYVRHYYIDFGDGFGLLWPNLELTARFGYAYGVDVGGTIVDYVTLGAIQHPWDVVEISTVAPMYGFYNASLFEPEKWKNGYPNPAFSRMQEEDGAWAARIIAHYTDAHIEAMMAEAKMADPVAEYELFRMITARRDKILDHYLRVRSPLAHFELQDTEVCFTDLATSTGVLDPRLVRYESRMYFHGDRAPRWSRDETPGERPEERVCVSLVEEGTRPATVAGSAPANAPGRYGMLDLVVVPEPGQSRLPPARLHFYDMGDEGFRLVGIERPDSDDPPRIR
jgi:hypothetical protein